MDANEDTLWIGGRGKVPSKPESLLNLRPRPYKGWSFYRHAEYSPKRQGRMQNKPVGQWSRSCHYVETL